jgi:hypothetical protein
MRKKGNKKNHEDLEDKIKEELEEKGFVVRKNIFYDYKYMHRGKEKFSYREIDLEATKYDTSLYFEVKSGKPRRDKAIGQLYHIANFFGDLFGKRQYYMHAYYDNKGNIKYDWIKNLEK